MPQQVKVVFGLIGGLALFLFGMNSMSASLQKAAGERMKRILAVLTRNPVMGALAGALVTAILQSSSATTVMAIGFVSAGLMGLPQAISVIFGSNIGTTITAQLIAFDIGDYIYPIIFVGFLISFVSKKEKIKNIGMVIFSFGVLFEGIEIMSSVMKPLAGSAFFVDMMSKVKDVPVLGVLLGTLMTLVVQSSSATIAVLQGFASTSAGGTASVIGLTGAIPILLGDNIGTTITALLASIGQSKDAKRTAIAHSTFNITGSVLFLFLIKPFASFIAFISPKGNEVDIISRQIANAHTSFNVVMTLIWLPLLPLMVKWVRFVIRGEDRAEDAKMKPVYLDLHMVSQPAAATILVGREISRSIGMVRILLTAMQSYVSPDDPVQPLKNEEEKKKKKRKKKKNKDSKENKEKQNEAMILPEESGPLPAVESLRMKREEFDSLLTSARGILDSTIHYISLMFSRGTLDEQQTEEVSRMLSTANDLDRICVRCGEIVDRVQGLEERDRYFSNLARGEMGDCMMMVLQMYDISTDLLQERVQESGRKVGKAKNKLGKAVKSISKKHLVRIREGLCDENMTQVYSQILYDFERIADNCSSISEEALAGNAETSEGLLAVREQETEQQENAQPDNAEQE